MHILPIPAALAAVLLAAPLHAQAPAAPADQIVRSADLDLGSGAGVAALDRRLELAVETACGPTSAADPAGYNRARLCRARLIADLRPQRDRLVAAARAATRLAAR